MRAVPLGLRLFLEGVEVPVISTQVLLNPDQPSMAQIQVIPTDMGLHLLPRTLAHLFYFDPDILPGESEETETSDTSSVPFKFDSEIEAEEQSALDTRYKTMFQGEVIGLNYAKTPISRSLILQCMDLSSYWDTCYQWFADYSAQGSGLTDVQHNFVGAKEGLFDNIAGGHKWVIGRILNTKPRTPEFFNTKGLLGGLIHLLEAIGGIRYRNPSVKGFNGVNDFFTIAELRYNLLGMLGAVEKDDTSAKMYASKAFQSWLRNGMTSMGSLLSFRDILNHVNKYIFHHVYPNPCAYYKAPGTKDKTRSRVVTVKTTLLGDSTGGGAVIQRMKIAFEDMVKAQNYFAGAAVEAGTDPESPEFYAPQHFEAATQFNKGWIAFKEGAASAYTALGYVERSTSDDAPAVDFALRDVMSKVADAKKIMSGIEPREGEIPNLGKKAAKLSKHSKEIADILKKQILPIKKRLTQTVTAKEGPRLYSQLVLPETFFVSPPRCNVIFPDQYHQFQYSRNFAREVTRLSCAGGLGLIAGRRGAKLFGHNYFAPNIKDVRGHTLRLTTQYGGRVLLPHEVHSGIIPKFEWVTDGHRWGVKAAKDSSKAASPVYKSGKVGYIQRLANFQFFLHRWASRSMALSGVYMPNLVLGFPGLVINTSSPSVAVIKALEKKLGHRPLPVQYLGKIASITHSINQQGGSTGVQFELSRTHRGLDDEFMGVLSREVEITKKNKFTEEFQTEDLVNNPSAGGDLRSGYLKLIKMYLSTPSQFKKGAWVPQFNAVIKDFEIRGNIILTERQAWRLGVSKEQFNTSYDYELATVDTPAAQAAKSTALSLPEVFTVDFEKSVGTGKFRDVELSPEEALAPGWYSSVWANAKIGKDVYEPLLGTLSITDNVDYKIRDQEELLERQYEQTVLGSMSEEDREAMKNLSLVGSVDGERTWRPKTGSIEEAIDSIVTVYSLLKNEGGDVHSFIRQFTKRPIANIENVLGSRNIEFGSDGNPKEIPPTMVEGFHSRAFGDYNTDVKLAWREKVTNKAGKNALLGLFPGRGTSPIPRGSIIDRGEKVTIDPRMDPRGRARARVEAYLEELKMSRGLVG